MAGAPSGGMGAPFDLGQDLLAAAVGAAAAGGGYLPLGGPDTDAGQEFGGLPVLETADRADPEPATVCEVLGCGASLEGLKRYYIRMRVCERHLNAQAIVVNGVVSRFCQQCAKWQFVGEFAGSKKSCIATLERHNARHRAKVLARQRDSPRADDAGGARGRGKGAKAGKAADPTAAAATAVRRRSAAAAASSAVMDPCMQGMAQLDGVAAHALASSDLSGGAAAVGGRGFDDVSGARVAAAGAATAAELAFVQQQQPQGMAASAADVSAAPSKPASPNYYPYGGWDGANGTNGQLPAAGVSIRPLVTTGGNGLVVAGERTGSGPLAAPSARPGLPPQPPRPMAAPHWSEGWAGGRQLQAQGGPDFHPQLVGGSGMLQQQQQPHQYHSHHHPHHQHPQQQQQQWLGHARSAHQQLPPPPLDVQRAMAAMPSLAAPHAQHHQHQNQHHQQYQQHMLRADPMYGDAGMYGAAVTTGVGGQTLLHVRRDDSCSDGNTPVGSNAVGGGSGAGGAVSDSSGAHSQATAKHAMMAAHAPAREGSVGPTLSGTSRSAAGPSASGAAGGTAMAANSPGTSSTEQDSAVRGSASASGSGYVGGDGGGAVSGGAAGGGSQIGNVAARINSIMEELCPLIAQFKQQVGPEATRGSAGAAAGLAAAASSGSPALPPVVESAVAMMQQASQLAGSLAGQTSWGGAAAAHPQPGGAYSRPAAPPAGPGVWRPLQTNPGIVVNVGALAPSYSRPPAQGSAGPQQQPSQQLSQQPRQQQQQQQATGFPAGQLAAGIEGMAAAAVVAAPPPGYYAPASSDSTAATAPYNSHNNGAAGPMYDGHQQQQYGGAGAGGARLAPAPPSGGLQPMLGGSGVSGMVGEDADDELLGQLLDFLDDPSDTELLFRQQSMQNQQQLQYRGMAAAGQQAVGAHQQAMQALHYGAPLRPLAWQPSLGAPVQPPTQQQQHPHQQQQHPQHQQQQQQEQPNPFAAVAHGGLLVAQHSGGDSGGGSGLLAADVSGGGVGGVPELAGDDVDPRELTRVSLKAMNVLPHELPPALRANLRRWLKEARAEALQATLRPGCLQLVVDVLRPASGPGCAPGEAASLLLMPHDPEQAAADVFRILGQRLRDTYVQSLLPLAVLSGNGRGVDVLAAFAAEVLREPLRLDAPQGPGGMSALHLAALLPDGGALAAHLVASQPWAAWAWLSLGWQPPVAAPEAPEAPAEATDGTTAPKAEGLKAADDTNEEDKEGGEEDAELPLPRPSTRLTPGSLSALLGQTEPLRRAARLLQAGAALQRAGAERAGEMPDPATAALMGAVEAWGRTGAALLSALCEQLGRTRL
ncbi:hypothetical protein GPECTOR_1g304 [Gonium pectorale]|uniref:SBP-type domain-containing protein n=1 Tax=Gonium pectorale TaxID=33097 RepID=A0A150H2T8_GONPE|nr:hypothetical protein GPECTOR_1g304 [Gonium pectorale]|eukprot:KXZ56344.1 hypothetical protein GPECTOR_1g304 [Gonium pectorale]